MTSRLNPYISFDGDARQAMEFYQQVFGGTLHMNTFGEFGMRRPAGRRQDHARACWTPTSGFTLMGADTPPGMEYKSGNNITVSLSGDDGDELRGYWEKLSERRHGRRCRWRSRCGATSSACAPTGSASTGWSTSAQPQA